MQVVLLSRDLMIVSRVSGAVDKQGLSFVAVGNAGDAIEACSTESTVLLIVDLQMVNADLSSLVSEVRQLRKTPPSIIAFGSHVHEARLNAARDVDCDLVLSRGQFDRDLDHLLEQWVE